MKRVAILTGGGDCPGLNAVIRAVVRRGAEFNYQVLGVQEGWRGFVEKNYVDLDLQSVSGILNVGGTLLGTSRTNPFKDKKRLKIFLANLKECQLDGIIAVGGEDTLGVAAKLWQKKIPIVGVPKTIDNDLMGTDYTFGFDTAVSIATEAIDRIHTTAESHNRVMVVEVMGRHAGWIATYSGLAGGADYILIPEEPFDIQDICRVIKQRSERGKNFSIIVVSEGARMKSKGKKQQLVLASQGKDEFGHERLGGIGVTLGKLIEDKTGYETRVTVLGHIQRGGSPTAHDRILATRYGVMAMECVRQQKFGRLVALKGNAIVDVPLSVVAKQIKTVDMGIYRLARVFFN
jgi:ATP-dependent phosphofructokinase / diphosphate-dependent phosphofructokinase